MSPSIWQILIVVILAVLLFGRGKISSVMGDVAKGINAFKRGMKDGADEDAEKKALEKQGEPIDVAASRSSAESSKS